MHNELLPDLEGTTLSGRPVHFPQDLPKSGPVLVIGFTHAARHDVGAWKAALAGAGIPFLSLPTAATDTPAESMESVASAMRAHVPCAGWDQVIQIHRGGQAMKQRFGWQADVFAKVLRVTGEGEVLARHDEGPFSRDAFSAFLG
jgi:hypothetical protein